MDMEILQKAKRNYKPIPIQVVLQIGWCVPNPLYRLKYDFKVEITEE